MAGNTFYLKIIAANRVFYAGRCRSLIVPEYDGQKEILAHHEDMVIAIDEGEMRFQPEGTANWEYAVVGMGFVEIVNNRVTLLVETAEHPEEIDVARAKQRRRRQLYLQPDKVRPLDIRLYPECKDCQGRCNGKRTFPQW